MQRSDWTINITSTSRDGSTTVVGATVEGVRFTVNVDDADLDQFGPTATLDDLITESFRFLLERESVGSILPRFNLPIIQQYFPEYPQELRRRLAGC